jgi:uncharacterized protein involved in exopolysaccharide biosynthesis
MKQPEPVAPEITVPPQDDPGLLDLAIVLAKHKRFVIGLPLVVAAAAAVISLLLPNIYTGTTKILPPQQTPSASAALLAQLGGLAGGVASAIPGLKNPNDLYVGMLKSRTIADELIERFDLKKRYGAEYMDEARKKLAGVTSIVSGRDSIITVEVDDKDPKVAAELANGYVDELFKLTKVLAVTENSQRRLFFERQLSQAKENLTNAEVAARRALGQGGLVKVDDQGRTMVETTARLRAQITVKEVQIGAMRSFAGEENPELRLAMEELEALKREMGRIEGSGGGKAMYSSASAKGMDNLGLLRDLKYHEVVYEMLARQFEMAKIDEAKDASVVQVMDKALEPEHKSKPVRSRIVLLSTLVALIGGIVAAFFREAMNRTRSDPRHADRLQTLRRQLTWRRSA